MLPHARVLVADDDLELLRSVADALERSGAAVVRAETGAQLIERMADEGPFELVITDVSMPWMSGIEAMHSARFAGLGTPVIVMTALDEYRLPEHVRALGPNTILLRKPFGLSELEAAAGDLLSATPPGSEPSGVRTRGTVPEDPEPVTKWLDTIGEHLSDGIVLTDTAGRITYQNRVALLLAAREPRDRDQFGNPTPFELKLPSGERLLPDDAPYVRATLHDELVPAQELVARQANGRLVPVLVSAVPIRDAAGKSLGAATILQDISDLKTLERFQDSWVSRVAHDLRQPINTIVLTSDLLLRGDASQEQRDRLARMRAAARRLSKMVGQLAEAFQAESHRVTVFRERLDVGAFVHDVAARVPDLGGKVRVRVPVNRRLFVQADKSGLERVLTTLLSCVAKSEVPEHEVGVRVDESDGNAEISVTCRGCKIPPDELAVAFGEHAPALNAVGGAGVGIYIAKGIIEAHGGRLWAEDVPDAVATFRMTLPLDGPSVPASDPRPPDEARATGGSR